MSSVQVQHKLTSLHIPFYCFKGSFDRSLNVSVFPDCLIKEFSRIVFMCFTVQLSRFSRLLNFGESLCLSSFALPHSEVSQVRQRILVYQSQSHLSTLFFIFLKNFFILCFYFYNHYILWLSDSNLTYIKQISFDIEKLCPYT